ncbi:MAG: hypothetical protein WC100_20815 [Sterolibacterium sp.]
MKQVTPVVATPNIRILKAGQCSSLSGKSKLTYHVGCDEGSAIYFRVHANSSSGYFSREWVSMAAIQKVLASVPADKAITSFVLQSTYVGQSGNNAGFLCAVLVAEHLVEPVPDKQRCYSCTDGKTFAEEMSALITSGVSIKVAEPVAKKAVKQSDKTVTVEATSSMDAPVQDAVIADTTSAKRTVGKAIKKS